MGLTEAEFTKIFLNPGARHRVSFPKSLFIIPHWRFGDFFLKEFKNLFGFRDDFCLFSNLFRNTINNSILNFILKYKYIFKYLKVEKTPLAM